MKRALIVLLLLGNITFGYAQYTKEKLTDVLTGGSSKSWTAKATKGDRPEKEFTFSKDMSVQVQKGGAVQNDKWSLTSADNIRWTITIGTQPYEMVVGYDKAGTQNIRLTQKIPGKTTGGYELTLYGTK